MRKVLIIFLSLLAVHAMASARSLTFAELRAMAVTGESITMEEDLELTGIITSDVEHPNLYDGQQVSYRDNSTSMNNRTVYFQSHDAKYGVRLLFAREVADVKKCSKYAEVTVSLKGAILKVNEKGAVSVEELPAGCVLSVKPGNASNVPVKHRSVNELTVEDIYTWVTLDDCEFVFKDGAYTNILESYALNSVVNSQYKPVSYMNTWQTLLCDKNATPFYMVINARTPWRRSGNGVPQGKGTISGILCATVNPRYSDVHAWQIRPFEESDIDFEWKGEGSFNTLCEWNWNDDSKTFKTNEGPVERFSTEKMLPDVGKGELSLDFTNSTYRGKDLNNPVLEPDKSVVRGARGFVNTGAMEIRTVDCNWWNWKEDCGSAITLKFSTKDIKSDHIFLAFTFSCGCNSALCSINCPAFWGIEVSTDNVNMARLNIPDIQIHALPWWERVQNGIHYTTSREAGMGMTEHLVELPAELIGQENVYVRIMPVKRNITTLADENYTNAMLRPNHNKHWAYISFGAITVRYK